MGTPAINRWQVSTHNLRICFEKCVLLLDLPSHSFPAVVHKVVEHSGLSEKQKAVLRNKLLTRDKNIRKKSIRFGDVVEDLMNDKAKAEKVKEQNDKLLRMSGKEAKMTRNDKLAWISGKGAEDQVAVKDDRIELVLLKFVFRSTWLELTRRDILKECSPVWRTGQRAP